MMFHSPYSAAYRSSRPSYHSSFFDQGFYDNDNDDLYQPTMRESFYQQPFHQRRTMRPKRNKKEVNQVYTISVRSNKEVEQQYNIHSNCSLKDLKTHLSNELEIPMESFDLVHNDQVLSNEVDSLLSLGIRPKSILTIRDREDPIIKQQVDKINKLSKELESLEEKANVIGLSARDAVILDELLTHLLEKIDGIETHGHINLRTMRKALVLRAQKASEIANVNKNKKSEQFVSKTKEESDLDSESSETSESEDESKELHEEDEPVQESDLDSQSSESSESEDELADKADDHQEDYNNESDSDEDNIWYDVQHI